MFGKKDSNAKSEKPIYLFTIDQVPGREYRALGLVRAETTKLGSNSFSSVIESVQEQARKLGADAIVGFREVGYASGTFSLLSAYGTAIVYTDKAASGDSE